MDERDRGAHLGRATLAGHGVGLARSRKARDGTHVESLWVHPAYRGWGVATRLLHELLWIEREHGVTQLFVWVFDSNTAAQSLYRHLGFKPTERRPITDGRIEVRLEIRLDAD